MLLSLLFAQATDLAPRADLPRNLAHDIVHLEKSVTFHPQNQISAGGKTILYQASVPDIRDLQRNLIILGYNVGQTGADGIYGQATQVALEKFQFDLELPTTGFNDSKTLDLLRTLHNQRLAENEAVETKVRNNVFAAVYAYIGIEESGGDNRGQDIAKFLRGIAPQGSAWCAGFASTILDQELPGLLSFDVSAKGMMRQTMLAGAYHDLNSDYVAKKGDLIFFDRDGWRGHVGFVVNVLPDGSIVAIEGNRVHPDIQEKEELTGTDIWDPNIPDAVRAILYPPEQFEHERILGFANLMEIYTSNYENQTAPTFNKLRLKKLKLQQLEL